MTVKEFAQFLVENFPGNTKIVLAYDSLVCQQDLEKEMICYVKNVKINDRGDTEIDPWTIYLCSMLKEDIAYCAEDRGAINLVFGDEIDY